MTAKKSEPQRRKIADHEMIVMSRVYDLMATLVPERRRRVYDFIGERLDDLPVLAQVEAQPTETVPMFPDAETRMRVRGGAA